MSNVILKISDREIYSLYSDHSLKIKKFLLGVGNRGFAVSYRFWSFQIDTIRNSEASYTEMTNVYFLQNGVTQSVDVVTATGGLEGFPASNLLIEDSSIWRDNSPTVSINFDFGKEVTLDEIKWKTTSNSSDYDPIVITIFASNDEQTYVQLCQTAYEALTTNRSEIVGELKLDSNVFFNTISPPSGGYTIYSPKEKLGPSITTTSDDEEMLTVLKGAFPRQEIDTIGQGFSSLIKSTDIDSICLNFIHETVTMRDCLIAVDASMPMSYSRLEIGDKDDRDPKEGTWYNLREVYDIDDAQMNLKFYPSNDDPVVYPTSVSSPGVGGLSIDFSGNRQSAEFYPMYNRDGLIEYDSLTAEIYCKFRDNLPDGVIFGFQTYGVHCLDGYIGFTTTNDTKSITGTYDTYGFTASGVTGSYVHLVFTFNYATSSYSDNKIYLNGQDMSLFQVFGVERSENKTYNSGLGRLSWMAPGQPREIGGEPQYSPLDSLSFEVQVFRLYNTLLTEEEIALNYTAFQSRFNL